MKILIAGAGGPLGHKLVEGFLARGHEVTALSYSGRGYEQQNHPRLKSVAADVTRPGQVSGLCRGIDLVVSCLGITRRGHRLSHMAVDYQGNLNLLREAEQQGTAKFAIITPVGAEHGEEHGVPLLRAKALFKRELRGSRLEWLIFRTGGFFADLAEMGKMAAKSPMVVIGPGTNVFTPVDIDDVARIMVEDCLVKRNEVIEIGGPEDMSWNTICETCFRHYGKRPRIVHVPVWICQAMLFSLKYAFPKGFAMGKLIVYMSTHDLPTERRGTRHFGDYLQSVLGESASVDREVLVGG